MYKNKHGTVSKQHPTLFIIIVTVSTLQKPVAKTCEDYVGCQLLLGRWYPWLEFWCWQRHHQCRHPHHQQHHQQTRTWGGGKYSWAKEGNYRMLHVTCSMYVIWSIYMNMCTYMIHIWYIYVYIYICIHRHPKPKRNPLFSRPTGSTVQNNAKNQSKNRLVPHIARADSETSPWPTIPGWRLKFMEYHTHGQMGYYFATPPNISLKCWVFLGALPS